MSTKDDLSVSSTSREIPEVSTNHNPVKTRDSLIREYVQQARKKLDAIKSPQPDQHGESSKATPSRTFPTSSSGASNAQYFLRSGPQRRPSLVTVNGRRRSSPRCEVPQSLAPASQYMQSRSVGHLPQQSVESTLTIDSEQWPVPGSPVPPIPSLQSTAAAKAPALSHVMPKFKQQPRVSQYTASLYSDRTDRNPETPAGRDVNVVGNHFPSETTDWTKSPFRDQPPTHHDHNPSIDAIPEEFESTSSQSDGHSRRSSRDGASEVSSSPYDLDRILSLPAIAAGETPQLVRQASLGRKHQATLTVIPPPSSPPIPHQYRTKSNFDGGPDDKALMPVPLRNTKPKSGPPSPALLSEFRSFRADLGSKQSSRTHSPASTAKPTRGKKLAPGETLFLTPSRASSLKDRVGSRKPPSLTIEPVPPLNRRRLEKARSQTSIAGLISRALRMASDLERGHTGNKNADWFEDELLKEKAARGKSTTSLNSMLDNFAFSPTVIGTSSRDSRRGLAGPSPDPRACGQRHARSVSEREKRWEHDMPPHSRKRCCGIPMGICILLFAVAFVLIALAIVLPITLIVVPNSKSHAPSVTGCEKTLPCANGGASVLDLSGKCQCVCTDDFTGSNCTTQNDNGCGPILTTTLYNASIGSKLASLIYNAESNFGIPLNASALIPIFSANDLNCDSQNGLIALSGIAARSLKLRRVVPLVTAPAASSSSNQQVVTSAGVAFDGSTATVPASAGPTGASMSSSGRVQGNVTASQTLGFAQTAILYVVQADNKLNSGVVAQSNLQNYMDNPMGSAKNVSLGDMWMADLVDFTLTSSTGGTVGETRR
ncbi:MAG: hypothetical protein M1828_001712 [Chrysothrix sp. TS-e1954]|nr:MAG: hypothetical protein M1828_001712 [Chrysothrix sp. TS-e1954]